MRVQVQLLPELQVAPPPAPPSLPSPSLPESLHLCFTVMEIGVPIVAQQKLTQLVSMRTQVRSLASISGSGIRHCGELWCRSQTGTDPTLLWLWWRPGSYSSDSTPSLGTSICHTCSPSKKTHNQTTKNSHGNKQP